MGVHVEVFAANRVVIVPAGLGIRKPWRFSAGRIVAAGCYGSLVTVDPTGLVLVRSGATRSLRGVFLSWGQPLTGQGVASFTASRGSAISVFVDGRRWHGPPGLVPLRKHAEIVIETGPYVPPHSSYIFPPGT
jgi:hypothetical protein